MKSLLFLFFVSQFLFFTLKNKVAAQCDPPTVPSLYDSIDPPCDPVNNCDVNQTCQYATFSVDYSQGNQDDNDNLFDGTQAIFQGNATYANFNAGGTDGGIWTWEGYRCGACPGGVVAYDAPVD
jgi:hypothetical protein